MALKNQQVTWVLSKGKQTLKINGVTGRKSCSLLFLSRLWTIKSLEMLKWNYINQVFNGIAWTYAKFRKKKQLAAL
jgi:hypothetical protein